MKVKKVFTMLLALCVAIWTPVRGKEGIVNVVDDSLKRTLRQESASFASTAAQTQDSTNPLRRRDQALVSPHRVYDPVSGLACSLVGICMECTEAEKDESYCRETGFRQELECPLPNDSKLLAKSEGHGRQTRYKVCLPADVARPGLAVVQFEAVIAVLLAVSVVLLRRERKNHMSLFDQRKDPGQCAGLLGGPATSDKSSD
ncbi:unnamed protein product [Peronospora farinosa]|uniref:Uncharacterized protein n=1 Tax=Peronospora farinosa TaxID=134698 RepID=A0AAV0UHU5_9STRA|nr:unnamed protein product [Peronospora farinosa]CAI5735713.1 unnamed protein product [Peronospora farinosa]